MTIGLSQMGIPVSQMGFGLSPMTIRRSPMGISVSPKEVPTSQTRFRAMARAESDDALTAHLHVAAGRDR